MTGMGHVRKRTGPWQNPAVGQMGTEGARQRRTYTCSITCPREKPSKPKVSRGWYSTSNCESERERKQSKPRPGVCGYQGRPRRARPVLRQVRSQDTLRYLRRPDS